MLAVCVIGLWIACVSAAVADVAPGDRIDRTNIHATRAALPSHEFPDKEGWYWNMGPKVGLTPDFFTVAELIRGGR